MTDRELSAALTKVVDAARMARKQLNFGNLKGCEAYVEEMESASKRVSHELLKRRSELIALELQGKTNIVQDLKETDRITP